MERKFYLLFHTQIVRFVKVLFFILKSVVIDFAVTFKVFGYIDRTGWFVEIFSQ